MQIDIEMLPAAAAAEERLSEELLSLPEESASIPKWAQLVSL